MSEKKKPWEARKEDINPKEFDETRRCLLNSYHSYVQTHAGYMIALIIGFLTLVSSFRSWFDSGLLWITLFLLLALVVVPVVSVYTILRIMYWTWCANVAIQIPLDSAIRIFNEENPKMDRYYSEEAPYTGILQITIKQQLIMLAKDYPYYKRLVLKTGGI